MDTEEIMRYSNSWKTPIDAETKLKVGDIVQIGTETIYRLTSVTKCFVTMECLHQRCTPPIFECEGSVIGVVVKVYKIDANEEGVFTRRKSRKCLIEKGCYLRTDLDNIYSVCEYDYLR